MGPIGPKTYSDKKTDGTAHAVTSGPESVRGVPPNFSPEAFGEGGTLYKFVFTRRLVAWSI